jgi:membrane complex biogenesis BtpA family protein
MERLILRGREVRLIAALHLPSMPGSAQPNALTVADAIAYARRNAAIALQNGMDGLYLQDLGDYPVARHPQPHTVAQVAAIGYALRQAFPDAPLGVCLMAHGAQGPLAVAQAMDADFVRLKVYVGAMVKAEGVLEGCAYEAIQYRAAIRAENTRIVADIHDRTGVPLAPFPLKEAAQQAVTYGRADGLILTGRNWTESKEMLADVRQAALDVPLLIGGGVTAANVAEALTLADGVIVSTALKQTASWTAAGLDSDWSAEKVRAFVAASRTAYPQEGVRRSPRGAKTQRGST